jgi:predicted DNA-binding protein
MISWHDHAMSSARRRNFHLPLDEPLYERLQRAAARVEKPATQLAREALEAALADRERLALHESIAEYAASVAGTPQDLDRPLEKAAAEHLRSRRRKRRS